MVSKFQPTTEQVYFINQPTLFHILEGQGAIQVDFKNYLDWDDKLIFLDKGQYIKFFSPSFLIRRIEFPDQGLFEEKDVRVLFKHLVSLGYIDFNACEDCQHFLTQTVFSDNVNQIIDVSSKQWFWQNPFQATKSEYHIIFDLKDIVDEQYKNHLTVDQLSSFIKHRGYDAVNLLKQKIGISVKSLLLEKRMTESKKEVAFSDRSIKEIGYDMGYKDPAYFSRVFKRNTGQSPEQFRAEFAFPERNAFIEELYHILKHHHQHERSLGFYADQMHMSVRTLSKKVRSKLNVSLGQLIRMEIIHTAKMLLQEEMPVKEVAFALGFEESNHFSTFFKLHTGQSPSSYKSKKYKQ